MWELSGQMHLNLLFMAILTFLLETNKQTKKKHKKIGSTIFFPTGANTTRQKVSTSRRSVGIFAEKFNLQQSSCILRHSGTHHTSIVLLAKKPAPHMEVRGEPLDFSRSKCYLPHPHPQ